VTIKADNAQRLAAVLRVAGYPTIARGLWGKMLTCGWPHVKRITLHETARTYLVIRPATRPSEGRIAEELTAWLPTPSGTSLLLVANEAICLLERVPKSESSPKGSTRSVWVPGDLGERMAVLRGPMGPSKFIVKAIRYYCAALERGETQ